MSSTPSPSPSSSPSLVNEMICSSHACYRKNAVIERNTPHSSDNKTNRWLTTGKKAVNNSTLSKQKGSIIWQNDILWFTEDNTKNMRVLYYMNYSKIKNKKSQTINGRVCMMLRKWRYPEVRTFCSNLLPRHTLRQPRACYLPVRQNDKHHSIILFQQHDL